MSIDERVDPVDLLSRYSAPNGWNRPVELTGPDADAGAIALLERIVGGTMTPTGPRRRHLRLVTGVIIAASLGGAAVAAGALLSRSPDELLAVSCWSEPVVPPDAQVGLGWDGLGDPIDICTDEWQGGGLGSEGPPNPLQACVTNEGVAAIMPGDDATCSQLGLSTFAPVDADAPQGQRILDDAELELALVNEFNLGRCLSAEAAGPAVRERLDELGFTSWTVSIAATFSGDEYCATVSVFTTTKTVSIVMIDPGD